VSGVRQNEGRVLPPFVWATNASRNEGNASKIECSSGRRRSASNHEGRQAVEREIRGRSDVRAEEGGVVDLEGHACRSAEPEAQRHDLRVVAPRGCAGYKCACSVVVCGKRRR